MKFESVLQVLIPACIFITLSVRNPKVSRSSYLENYKIETETNIFYVNQQKALNEAYEKGRQSRDISDMLRRIFIGKLKIIEPTYNNIVEIVSLTKEGLSGLIDSNKITKEQANKYLNSMIEGYEKKSELDLGFLKQ